MKQVNLNQVMDELYAIINTSPVEDAVTSIMRHLGQYSNVMGMEALARLLVVESTRRRYAEARAEAGRISVDTKPAST
ncbi:MAG: hypothetical protein IJD16_04445 [Desulfovibrio sp.]|nr:hypothetical protein [Desulfovibrio sp.]